MTCLPAVLRFAPPPLQRPLLLGADAVMHATTKALAGHSDSLGGALCVASAEVAKHLREDRTALGSTPGSLEVGRSCLPRLTGRCGCSCARCALCTCVSSGSRTRPASSWSGCTQPQRTGATRHGASVQDASHEPWPHSKRLFQRVDSTKALAGKVISVQHPSLTPWASKQMTGFGGCFALELHTEQAAQALPAALRLFRSATSLGGVAPWSLLLRDLGPGEPHRMAEEVGQGDLAPTAPCLCGLGRLRTSES